MITFDVLTLKAFLNEEKDFLTGARINKIQQPTRREFVFTLRNNGISRQFYVNITPQMYHVCFMAKDNTQKRRLEIPQKPPMFCMQLRKYLENSRISKVNQPDNERILEFYIETYSEIGDKIYLCLAFELMGKYSNVILYNCDTDIIIGCAHNVGAEKSRKREIYGGIPYIYPPSQIKSDILNYNGEVNYESLSSDFNMFSGAFAKLCQGKTLEQLKNYVLLKNLKPAITKDFKSYCIYEELITDAFETGSVNEMIDTYYTHYIELEKFTELKNHYKSDILQKLKKITKTLQQMENQIKSSSEYDKYRLFGDLIMANLYNQKDYTEAINVYDYENNQDITIRLDPLKTLKDNANTFYKLYNKSKTARTKLGEFIESYRSKKEYLEQVLYSIENSQNIDELDEISPEIEEQKTTKKQQPPTVTKFELDDGSRIFVGKNNKQNDYIVSKLADDEDLWFHVHNCAGSHVLLKTQNLTDELILYCAKLAKEYSTAANNAKTGVIYTKRKYLKKPPGAALGYVTYRNEKEIIV